MQQTTVWCLMQRARDGFGKPFTGPVEVDETYFDGKERSRPEAKNLRTGQDGVGKAIGAQDAGSQEQCRQRRGCPMSKPNLLDFIEWSIAPEAQVFTGSHTTCQGLKRWNVNANHTSNEQVHGMVRTNGIESFQVLFGRRFRGNCLKMSTKRLPRRLHELAGRRSSPNLDVIDQIDSWSVE